MQPQEAFGRGCRYSPCSPEQFLGILGNLAVWFSHLFPICAQIAGWIATKRKSGLSRIWSFRKACPCAGEASWISGSAAWSVLLTEQKEKEIHSFSILLFTLEHFWHRRLLLFIEQVWQIWKPITPMYLEGPRYLRWAIIHTYSFRNHT